MLLEVPDIFLVTHILSLKTTTKSPIEQHNYVLCGPKISEWYDPNIKLYKSSYQRL
jgi:hypothetical protein